LYRNCVQEFIAGLNSHLKTMSVKDGERFLKRLGFIVNIHSINYFIDSPNVEGDVMLELERCEDRLIVSLQLYMSTFCDILYLAKVLSKRFEKYYQVSYINSIKNYYKDIFNQKELQLGVNIEEYRFDYFEQYVDYNGIGKISDRGKDNISISSIARELRVFVFDYLSHHPEKQWYLSPSQISECCNKICSLSNNYVKYITYYILLGETRFFSIKERTQKIKEFLDIVLKDI